MSVNNGGNFYGVVGQSLTPEYLARQLPMFQQKVPKSTQVRVDVFHDGRYQGWWALIPIFV